MEPTIKEILSQNRIRQSNFAEDYDPLFGVGSPIERVEVIVDGKHPDRLPIGMMEEVVVQAIAKVGDIKKAASKLDVSADDLARYYYALRCKYDYEFWCASCVMIKPKDSEPIPFVLNHPQRRYLAKLEEMRLGGKPIRLILLKARQWGGSTLTEMYMAWIQMFHRPHFNALAVAHLKEVAKNIMGMYEFMISRHPAGIVPDLKKLELVPYMRTQNYRYLKGRTGIIGVASSQEPEGARSFTWQLMHLSEVGLWESTEKIKAEEFASALAGSLVDQPYTVCVKESTAKGIGSYFHKEWLRANNGESEDLPLFVGWWQDPQYQIDVPEKGVAEFIKSWSDYEAGLWKAGATIEGIAWYRKKRSQFTSDFLMRREFPTNPEEAFQSTGNRVFANERVAAARTMCKPPLAVGNLLADTMKGAESLNNIVFQNNYKGYLKVWEFPNMTGLEEPHVKHRNRYCAFGDIGGTTSRADYSVLTVLDRMWTLYGGVPRVAAEFHGHLDQDLFAWYCARICRWYDNALLAIEVNSLRSDKGDVVRGFDPDHSYTVLDEIKEHYDNLYYRVRPETVKENWDGVVGFHMNQQTKPMLIDTLNAALRDNNYEERNAFACDEMDLYELKPDGKMGAVDGEHDDRVISRAGAIWLSGQMDPVSRYDIREKQRTAKKGNFATFN